MAKSFLFLCIFTDETVDELLKLEAIDMEVDIAGLELEATTAEGVCFGGDIRCNAMFTVLLFRLSL